MLTETSAVPHSKSTQWLPDLLWLAALLTLFFLLWLGCHALLVPDEARYSEIAREMVASGDYITPHLNGAVFLDKPIFYYWLQSASIKLFGLREWSVRLWPAICGIFSCLMLYVCGRIVFDRRSGILAALVLATSPLYFAMAHYANLDLEVATFITASLAFFLAAMQFQVSKRRFIFLLCSYLFAGIAFLTKGMMGIAFPIMIIGAWIILLNRWRLLTKIHLFIGCVIIVAINLPWFILVQKANPEFFQYFFINQQFSRFLTSHFNDQQPFWFYLPIVLIGVLPWLAFFGQAVAHNIKLVWQDRQQYANQLYILLWLSLIFIFFSIPASKTLGYILPVFPPIALLTGNYLSTLWEKTQLRAMRMGVIYSVMLYLLIGVGLLILPYIPAVGVPQQIKFYLNLIAGIFLLAAGAVFAMRQAENFRKIILIIMASSIVSLLIIGYAATYMDFPSVKPLALTINHYAQPGDEVASYYIYYHDLPFYTQRRITVVSPYWNDEDVVHGDNWRHQLSDGMQHANVRQWLIDDATFWQQWQSNKRIFVLVDVKYLPVFLKHAKNKFYKLNEFQGVSLLTNKK